MSKNNSKDSKGNTTILQTLKKFSSTEYMKLGIILFTITFVVALTLGVVNAITKDRIVQIKIDTINNSMKSLMPEGDEFIDANIDPEDIVNGLFIANSGGVQIGYCVLVSPIGFGGNINITVALDMDKNVIGVNITSMKETPGLGTKVNERSFLDLFNGKIAPFNIIKGPSSSDDDISAITSATVSSNAVVTGINAASEYVNKLN